MADIDYLRQVPLFSRLSEANLQRLADSSHRELFRRRSHLTDAGQPGAAFFCILSGEAVVYAGRARGRPRPVGYLQAGSSFGMTSLLLGEPHDATVVATTDVWALMLDRAMFSELKRQVPDLEAQLVLPAPIQAKLRYGRFRWLDPAEVVVYFGRRHWFVFAWAMLLPTLGVLTLAPLLLLLVRFLGLGTGGLLAVLAIASFIYIPVTLWNLTDWRNDYFVVTTDRVVRRELVVYQYEARQEAPLTRIQNVAVKRNAWGNLLGFGNVQIETAAPAQLGQIVFDHVADPEAARDAIMQQLNRAQVRSRALAQEAMRHELKRQLGWMTSEELERQRQSRVTPPPGQAEPRKGWLARLPRPRLLPPLRSEEGDRITWRKHWVFLARKLAKPLLAANVWFTVVVILLRGRIPLFSFGSGLGLLIGLFISGFLIAFWTWWQVVDWENDIYVLSDTVLIDIEKKPLFFSEEHRETTLDRVQDVNMVIPNAFATLMDYGNVDIQTAGKEGKFTFTHVPAPRDVQRSIMGRVARFRERQRQADALQRRREMTDWFTVYEDLRRQREESQPNPPAPS